MKLGWPGYAGRGDARAAVVEPRKGRPRAAFTIALCLAVWAVPGRSQAGVGLGIYRYDVATLEAQKQDCEEQGPHPSGGCDQCLARAVTAQLFQFCGDDYPYTCHGFDKCQVCNGVCDGGVVAEGEGTSFFIAHSPDIVDAAINGCHQWVWQQYCPDGNQFGAYTKLFAVDIGNLLPGDGSEDYGDLRDDAAFWEIVARLRPLPETRDPSERAWRQRAGVFSLLIDEQGGPESAETWILRAFEISVWVWLDYGRPGGFRPTDVGFPSDIPPDIVQAQARDIEGVTCLDGHFWDCGLTPAIPKTWGMMKAVFR